MFEQLIPKPTDAQSQHTLAACKAYFVIQNMASFRVNWGSLMNGDSYTLILITRRGQRQLLRQTGQERYFGRIVEVDHFSPEHIAQVVEQQLWSLRLGLEHVRILCHDEFALLQAAGVRELTGIPGPKPCDLEPFVDKVLMKKAMASHNVRIPKYHVWDGSAYAAAPEKTLAAIESALGYPMFAKPTRGSCSAGTTKICDRPALQAWALQHQGSQDYESDEWIEGTLYHCDSVVSAGRILCTQVSRYARPCHDFLGGAPCGSIVLPRNHPDQQRLANFTKIALNALRPLPENTVTHLEAFIDNEGEAIFLEVAARAPAALVPATYERYTGINIEEAHFRLQMGLPLVRPRFGPFAAWLSYPHRRGRVTRLNVPRVTSNTHTSWRVAVNDRLETPTDILQTAMTLQLWHSDYAILEQEFAQLTEFVPYDLQH